MLLKVFDRVRSAKKMGRLLLIGDGPDRGKLETLISTLSSVHFIKILPPLPQEKLFNEIGKNKGRRQTLLVRGARSVKKMFKGLSKRNPFTSKY